MLTQISRIGAVCAGILSPSACFNCRRFTSLESRYPLCASCESRWVLNKEPPNGSIFFAMPYTGVARKLIQRFKIEEAEYLAPLLVRALSSYLAGTGPDFSAYDALVPIPSHNAALFGSWSSASRIADILSELVGLPIRALLRRARPIRKQSLLSRDERRANVRGAFRVSARGAIRGSFLLVDDVLTTGFTAEACAEALVERGASSVGVFAAARGELA